MVEVFGTRLPEARGPGVHLLPRYPPLCEIELVPNGDPSAVERGLRPIPESMQVKALGLVLLFAGCCWPLFRNAFDTAP